MNSYLRLLPELFLSLGGTAVLLITPLRNDKNMRDFARWFSLLTLICAAVALGVQFGQEEPFSSSGWVVSYSLNLVFALIFVAIVAWIVVAGTVPEASAGEWYSLLLFASVGLIVLARTGNLASLFLGVETLSLALYVLIAFTYTRKAAIRAGTMYLVLAGFASGFLVFGMALAYAVYGTINIDRLGELISSQPQSMNLVAILGFGLFFVGVAFKLSLIPFHMWAPEVYESSQGMISGFIASASKGAVIAAFLPFVFLLRSHWVILWLFAAASMIGGNLLGLRETRVKRILAYSSIGHIGYLMVGYLAARGGMAYFTWPTTRLGMGPQSLPTVDGVTAIVFYVVAYAICILGAFGILSYMERDQELTLRDMRSVARRNQPLAICLMVFVVSLAGIPPTIGFWGKIYLFAAGVNAGYIWLVVLGLIGSAIGIFYYLRIIAYLFMMPGDTSDVKVRTAPLQDRVMIASALVAIFFGLFPETLFFLLRLR